MVGLIFQNAPAFSDTGIIKNGRNGPAISKLKTWDF